MVVRIYSSQHLEPGISISLEPAAARHVQVLRLQPQGTLTLFNGLGHLESDTEGEFLATVERMGRSTVDVLVGAFKPTQREAARAVHLAVGMPANDRMDWLVEKATELGVASIQPLVTERSVLRLSGERADKKRAHWQSIAAAACEQCGRNRVPIIHAAAGLNDWLKSQNPTQEVRLLLSLQASAQPLIKSVGACQVLTFLSGPEGGLSLSEEAAAVALGFEPVTVGSRVLRSETAPLACLAYLMLTGTS